MGTTVGSSTKTLHLHCVGTIIFSLSFDSIFLLTIFYFLLALLLFMARLLCYEQIIWLFVRSFCHLICYGYVYLLAARFIYVIKFRFFSSFSFYSFWSTKEGIKQTKWIIFVLYRIYVFSGLNCMMNYEIRYLFNSK